MVSKLFRAYGLYNKLIIALKSGKTFVSKLFRAYGLYNRFIRERKVCLISLFQSSFELTGYITMKLNLLQYDDLRVSKLFRAYGLYNNYNCRQCYGKKVWVSKLFRAYGLYNLCSLEGA